MLVLGYALPNGLGLGHEVPPPFPPPPPSLQGPTRILRESAAKNRQLPSDFGPRGIISTEVLWAVGWGWTMGVEETAKSPHTPPQ